MIYKLPPYVVKERTRHGKTIFYFRRNKGARIRLPSPREANFMAVYLSALSGTPIEQSYIKPVKKEPKTLKWLITKYQNSSHWAGLNVNTRKLMNRYLIQAVENSNNADYTKITSKHIRNALEARKDKVGASINFLRAMQGLFKWAFTHEYVNSNPCIGIETPKSKTGGHTPWAIEDIKLFRKTWTEGTQQRLAFEFLLYTGLRVSDACCAGYQHLKDNIMAAYGWKSVSQAELYTKGADRVRLGIKNSRLIASKIEE